jgi:WD40 repeat protein
MHQIRYTAHQNRWFGLSNKNVGHKYSFSPIRTLDHVAEINAIQFSPHGDHLATISAWSVQIFCVESGKEVATYVIENEEQGRYYKACVSFTQDARYIAFGCDRGVIKVGDIQERRVKGLLKGHSSTVSCLHYSSNGRSLVSGSAEDRSIRLWDMIGGTEHSVVFIAVTCMLTAVSPDCQFVAGFDNDASVCFFETATGSMVRQLFAPGLGPYC